MDSNSPLTIDELRKMDGQPVWLSYNGAWCLVSTTWSDCEVCLINSHGSRLKAEAWIELYGPIYRRPISDTKKEEDTQ